MCKEYNGYTNYQTWVTALWLDNDRGSYHHWRERAKDLDGEVWELAKELQSDHEENTPTSTGVYADLLGHALGSVNWFEIAENICEELDE